MLKFFKSTQSATLIVIPVIILIFWLQSVYRSMPVTDSISLPVWDILVAFFSVFPSWMNFIFLFALICLQAIYLNIILNKHEVLYKNSYLPALIFALFISCSPELMQFHPVHFVNLIVIRIIDRAFMLLKGQPTPSPLFDSGFLAGIASIIYFPAIILLPFLLTMLVVLLPFRIKDWLILIIGFLLPFFLLSTLLFWNREMITFWHSYFGHFRNLSPDINIAFSPALISLAVSLSLLLLFALLKLRINYRKNVIRTRNFQQVFFILFLFSSGWLILINQIKIIHFAFIIIPACVFCAYYFLSAKKRVWMYETFLWSIIAIGLWNHLS